MKLIEDTKIQVRFPHDVWSEMKRLAKKHERSFNGEVLWALREYMNGQNEEQCKASPALAERSLNLEPLKKINSIEGHV